MKNYDQNTFLEKLNDVNWQRCTTSNCVNENWNTFRELFTGVLDQVAPQKEIRVKQRTEPWMTAEILNLIKERDHFLSLHKKYKKHEHYKQYCYLRNKVQREVKSAKSSYFTNKIEENRNEPKKLWEQLKNLGYKDKAQDTKIVLNIYNQLCHDLKTIVNHFNSFFTNVASELVKKLPSAKGFYNTTSNLFVNFFKKRNPSNKKLILKEVSEDFVFKELSSLNISKSTGLDEIPARFIRDGAHIIKTPITAIINQSIISGVVPQSMKYARVKPLYKKNSPLEVGNYRPVSILSIVSKILERSVYKQVIDFLQENNMLYDLQSGFRSKYSTDTCLIYLLDYIRSNNAKGLYTGMIMLDLQKAFDTVDHNILCNKLKVMGIESIDWFKSYLSDRVQFVSCNNTMSEAMNVSCGVPQGSILGPLLFLTYVNDMSISIDNECKLILYADDSAILFSHRDPNIISDKLGNVLESCSDWLIDNKLSLHLGKTECMLFGPPRKIKQISEFCVKCYDHVIKSTDYVKYLGVYIDKYLNCERIISSIVQKVNGRLKFLYRNAKCLDSRSRMTLTTALIQCYFDYSCSAWYSSIGKGMAKKLQVLQNKVVRFILGLGSRDSVNCQVLDQVNMLSVENRVKQLRLNHVYNIHHGKAPSYLSAGFHLNHSNTRSTTNINYCVPNTSICGKNSFLYHAILDWNSLPISVKNTAEKSSFKSAVKQHLKLSARSIEESEFLYY